MWILFPRPETFSSYWFDYDSWLFRLTGERGIIVIWGIANERSKFGDFVSSGKNDWYSYYSEFSVYFFSFSSVPIKLAHQVMGLFSAFFLPSLLDLKDRVPFPDLYDRVSNILSLVFS